ncbi:MAG: hypothetical protein KGS09_13180 [Nitrospirae bacterium]|nr:hypothetical protein [Nitrospirota bacterium]
MAIQFLLIHLLPHLLEVQLLLPLPEVVVLLSGLSRLFGLFGLSRWPDREINQTNQTNERDKLHQTAQHELSHGALLI